MCLLPLVVRSPIKASSHCGSKLSFSAAVVWESVSAHATGPRQSCCVNLRWSIHKQRHNSSSWGRSRPARRREAEQYITYGPGCYRFNSLGGDNRQAGAPPPPTHTHTLTLPPSLSITHTRLLGTTHRRHACSSIASRWSQYGRYKHLQGPAYWLHGHG
jgi:hypothetical protein